MTTYLCWKPCLSLDREMRATVKEVSIPHMHTDSFCFPLWGFYSCDFTILIIYLTMRYRLFVLVLGKAYEVYRSHHPVTNYNPRTRGIFSGIYFHSQWILLALLTLYKHCAQCHIRNQSSSWIHNRVLHTPVGAAIEWAIVRWFSDRPAARK